MTNATVRRDARRWLFVATLSVFFLPTPAPAEKFRVAEPTGDSRVFSVQLQVTTEGTAFTTKSPEEKAELPMKATAVFDFQERRLPPAGRDAEALRCLREVRRASLETLVAEHRTQIEFPADRRVIVSNGTREGITCYSLDGPLSRETADLLEIPGDPLTLIPLLPPDQIEVAEEWTPPDWVLQMLTGIEAAESSQCKCRLDQATPHAAKITFTGKIVGLKLGAKTIVEVAGAMIFDRENEFLSQAKTIYRVQAGVGVINPGLKMTVTSVLGRKVETGGSALAAYPLESVPLEAPARALDLTFAAQRWGLEFNHGRDWHLFHAVYDGTNPVAILRLMQYGSLVAQCNLSPIADAAPGQTVPLEQFEKDIQQSLGKRFVKILDREQIPVSDNRRIFRVVVEGQVDVTGAKGTAQIPMNWIYYLVAAGNGKQASFVFAVEPSLMEQLATQDRQIVESLRFVPRKG